MWHIKKLTEDDVLMIPANRLGFPQTKIVV